MSFLLDLLVGFLPDAWILAALAAGGLYLYQLVSPVGTRWIVSAGSVALAVLSGVLYGDSQGRSLCEDRVRRAIEAERVRQESINERRVAESRQAADAARKELDQMRARLEEAIDVPDPTPTPSNCGLSRERLRNLRGITSGSP